MANQSQSNPSAFPNQTNKPNPNEKIGREQAEEALKKKEMSPAKSEEIAEEEEDVESAGKGSFAPKPKVEDPKTKH